LMILQFGKDYTLAYADNVNAGVDTGKVTVTAIPGGNVTWATPVVKTFTIDKADWYSGLWWVEVYLKDDAEEGSVDIAAYLPAGAVLGTPYVDYETQTDLITGLTLTGTVLSFDVDAGSVVDDYAYIYIPVESDNYIYEFEVYVLITDLDVQDVAFESGSVTITYGGTVPANPLIGADDADDVSYWVSGDPLGIDIDSETGEITITEAGTYVITAEVECSGYVTAYVFYTLTVSKADLIVKPTDVTVNEDALGTTAYTGIDYVGLVAGDTGADIGTSPITGYTLTGQLIFDNPYAFFSNNYNITVANGTLTVIWKELGTTAHSWTQGTTNTVVITSNGDFLFFVKLIGIKADLTEVELILGTDYTIKQGSTIATLTPAGLGKLGAGAAQVRFQFVGGLTTATINITPATSSSTPSTPSTPSTVTSIPPYTPPPTSSTPATSSSGTSSAPVAPSIPGSTSSAASTTSSEGETETSSSIPGMGSPFNGLAYLLLIGASAIGGISSLIIRKKK